MRFGSTTATSRSAAVPDRARWAVHRPTDPAVHRPTDPTVHRPELRGGTSRLAGVLALVMVARACSVGQSAPATLRAAAWQVQPASFPPGVLIAGVAPGDGSQPWIAVGWSIGGGDDQPSTRAFVSDDARSWRSYPLVPDDLDGSHTRLLSVGRLDSTLVAAGVAVGALHGNLRPTLWRAGPSQPLNELNLPRELFGGPKSITFDGLATGPLGGFVTGTWTGSANEPVAQVWHTSDGLDWERLDGIAPMASTTDELLAGRAVAVGPNRVVMIGAAFHLSRLGDGDDGAVWWSDDGRRWTRAATSPAHLGGPGDQELRAVAPTADGFVAGGSDAASSRGGSSRGDSSGGAGGSGGSAAAEQTAAIWWSGDGISWHRAAGLPAAEGRQATVTALASGGGRRWAAGVVGGAPRLWSSRDGQTWNAEPLPPSVPETGVQSVTMAAGAGLLMIILQMPDRSLESVIPVAIGT